MNKLIPIFAVLLVLTLTIPHSAFAVKTEIYEYSEKIGFKKTIKTFDEIRLEKAQQRFIGHFYGDFNRGQIDTWGVYNMYNRTMHANGYGTYDFNWNNANKCIKVKMPQRILDDEGNALQITIDGKLCKTKNDNVKKLTGTWIINKAEGDLKGTNGFGTIIMTAMLKSHNLYGVMRGTVIFTP